MLASTAWAEHPLANWQPPTPIINTYVQQSTTVCESSSCRTNCDCRVQRAGGQAQPAIVQVPVNSRMHMHRAHTSWTLCLQDPACCLYSSALLFYKGYHALQTHRIAHTLWHRNQKVMARTLQSRVSEVCAIDIHPAARIGKGILLDHGTGVVIGETAVIGENVSIMQNVTLGGASIFVQLPLTQHFKLPTLVSPTSLLLFPA